MQIFNEKNAKKMHFFVKNALSKHKTRNLQHFFVSEILNCDPYSDDQNQQRKQHPKTV